MSKSDESMDDDAKYLNNEEEENENIDESDEEDIGDVEKDDDSDDDDDDNIEDENNNEDNDFEEKFNFLKKSIEENSYAYQNYVDIIELTRNNGDLNNLRMYREKMSELFPLTEKLWLAWISDEKKFIESNNDREKIYDLFEKAVQDYLSIEIWYEYIQFSISGLNEPNGIERIRSICERAISVAGYHVKDGLKLWEVYREIETAILAGLQQTLDSSTNSQKIEDDITKQTNRIANILKRQINVSLEHMEDSLNELKALDEKYFDEESNKNFKNAIVKLKELEPFETELENSTTSDKKLENYKKYLRFEMKSNEKLDKIEPRIQCLFERTIADGSNCLDPIIWLMYTDYLSENSRSENDQKSLLQVFKRALRNSPWTGKLWANYALCLEYNEASEVDIKKAYNDGMNSGLQTSVEYLELWHSYLDFLRRNLYSNKEKKNVSEEEIETLRETFQTAINQLYQFFKHEGDPTFSLEKYWAYVEAKYFKNMDKARKIWNEMIIQKGMGRLSNEWIQFFEFETEFGEDKHQRKVLLRGLNESIDSKDKLCELLLKFEKQNGTIESYNMAKLKYDIIMREINEENLKLYEEENKNYNNKNNTNIKKTQKQQQQQQQQQQSQKQKQPQQKQQSKQKQSQESDNKNLKRKKSEEEVQIQSKSESKVDNEGFVIPALPSSTTQPAPKKIKNSKDESEVECKQPSTTSQSIPYDGIKKISNNMVFLSNLAYDVKQEDIENALKNVPGFKGVRIVKHWSGKSKGFGYADFDKQSNALEALKLDRTPINGRPMFISQVEDKSLKLGSSSSFKYANGLEKNKLFVSNLPFNVDQTQIENIFKTFGKLKQVRIVTYRSGKSKGLAYVDFEDESSAAKALMQTDNMLVGENQISVAISNPPKRGQKEESGEKLNPIVSSLGSGSVKSSAKMRGKGQAIDLMPRSLATKISTQPPKEESMQVDKILKEDEAEKLKNIQLNDKNKEKKALSNEDFRAFLLKKN